MKEIQIVQDGSMFGQYQEINLIFIIILLISLLILCIVER